MKPSTVTMMELRAEPGEYFYRRCYKGGESFLVTYQGKPIAKTQSLDCVINSKGKVTGEKPLTLGVKI